MRAKQLFAAALVAVSLCAALPGFAQQVQSDAGVSTNAVKDGGVTPQASTSAAAAAGDAAAPTTSTTAPTLAAPVSTLKKSAPPPPPPTPEQIAALNKLQEEADAYAKGAKDYRDTVTTIIKLHYEEKKKSILSGLDKEITTEKEELRKAREIAIQRLEDFIAKYPSEPEATSRLREAKGVQRGAHTARISR